jgi:hypothetical protein
MPIAIAADMPFIRSDHGYYRTLGQVRAGDGGGVARAMRSALFGYKVADEFVVAYNC